MVKFEVNLKLKTGKLKIKADFYNPDVAQEFITRILKGLAPLEKKRVEIKNDY